MKNKQLHSRATLAILMFASVILLAGIVLLTVRQMPAEPRSSQAVMPVTLADGEHINFLGTFRDSAVASGMRSYASDELGISLKYPEGYLLFDRKENQSQVSTYQNFQTISIAPKEPILQSIARARAGFYGEGPYMISFSFFYEPQLKVTNIVPIDYLKRWLTAHDAQSNFYPDGQGPGTVPATLAPTTVNGVSAFRYQSLYGLYETDIVAFIHNDRIVIVSAPTDPSIHRDFEKVLSSVQFTK